MIDPKEVTLCLITKDPWYPPQILNDIQMYGFGEILILTNSDSPFRKYELFKKAKFPLIAYQDDDALCPWSEILRDSDPEKINLAMKDGHYYAYQQSRMTMGIGWGSIFPSSLLQSLERYVKVYGEDHIFKRETERILTYLNYPQNRMILPIVDLPSAMAPDRLWRQPQHNQNIQIVEERCRSLIESS